MASPRIPRVDLTTPGIQGDLIVRAGDVTTPPARAIMQRAYTRGFRDNSGAQLPGVSVLFRPGATFDELAREGQFLNARLSYGPVATIRGALAAAGYELVLYVTPSVDLPDHHTLAVARTGVIQPQLPDAAFDALRHALRVADNAYRRQRL